MNKSRKHPDDNFTAFEKAKMTRIGLGLTQTQLAERMGVAKQTISRIEHGALLVPDLKVAIAYEDELGIPVRDWLRGAA